MDILDYLTRYGNFAPDIRTLLSENIYYKIGTLMLSEMFEMPSLNLTTFKLCEILCNLNGYCVIGRKTKDSEIVVGYPIFDEIDDNLQPILTGATTLKGDKMTEYYLIRNNVLYRGEHSIISRFAYQLSKVDFSQGKLTDKSVCNPIPVAHNNKMFEGIKASLKSCGNDDITVLYDDTDSWSDDVVGKVNYDLIDFTNVAYSDKFKYLSSYHNDLTSRAFFLYGFALQSPTKQAQTNDSELDFRNECSDIYISSRYATRYDDYKKACEGLGIEFNFDWSSIWRKSNATVEETNETNNEEEGVNIES